MTVDLAKLSQCLRQLEAEPDGDITQRGINPYLLEHVILPYLSGEDVDMGTLDYSAFSPDDILDADKEIGTVSNGANRVSYVMQFFKKAPPTARQTKAFC